MRLDSSCAPGAGDANKKTFHPLFHQLSPTEDTIRAVMSEGATKIGQFHYADDSEVSLP